MKEFQNHGIIEIDYISWRKKLEDINVIIRSICQDLYENLRYNNSIFANYKSLKYLKKLRKINITTDYKYAENIRDEIGILYKNYIVFCRKKEYENHSKIIEEIKKMYFEISYSIEQLLVNDGIKYTYKEYKNSKKNEIINLALEMAKVISKKEFEAD